MVEEARMSYPPPPEPNQYTPLYSAAPGAQLSDDAPQEQLPFDQAANQGGYSKLEAELANAGQINDGQHPPEQRLEPVAQTEAHHKGNRLRKACDSCSVRKVKCDESGPPCRACSALDIPCTFDRPSRRRGPPNKHAEAIKKRRIESPAGSGPSTPSSPTHAAQALAALSAQTALSAESICPLDTLELLINDFFTYIHPLCPFPHEPTFREAFRRREDFNSGSFLALLASMVGVLVASFPRKPRLHLKAQRKENLFPNHMSLVTKCQQVCAFARGPGYLENDDLSVYDAATSYFLGLIGAYTYRWRHCRLYFGECLTIIRSLGLHKNPITAQPEGAPLDPIAQLASLEQAGGIQADHVTQEVARRVFWATFVSARSMQQFGTSIGEFFISPGTSTEPYPPLPIEVDDIFIYPTHIEPQPPNVVSLISGFNANVRVFMSYDPIATNEMAYGIDEVFDWGRQKRLLHQSLQNCKQVLNNLPPELTVVPGAAQFGQHDRAYHPPIQEYQGIRDMFANALDTDSSPEARRRVQYEIQKANVYASHLGTRSYIVEKYWNLCEAHNKLKAQGLVESSSATAGPSDAAGLTQNQESSTYDLTEQEMYAERESIVKDLLLVLSSISQVNMEPNAESFTMKIRSIASTLLDVPKSRKGSVALQAEEYLAAFLDILVKLERVGPAEAERDRPHDEESELRHWADLRDYQMKFAQTGGVLAFS